MIQLLLRKYLSDARVEQNYIQIGTWIGSAISYAYMGEPIGMAKKVDQWEQWEQEYSKRGYKTISLDRFVDLGGYSMPITDVIHQKRDSDEQPIYHAQIYKERYLGKVQPAINLERMVQDGQPQVAQWQRPSTGE